MGSVGKAEGTEEAKEGSMRIETIIKRLEEALTERDGRKAREKLEKLLYELKLRASRKDQDDGKVLQHMVGWYLQLWEQKPPEMYRFLDHKSIVAKQLRELITIYRRNGEDIEKLKEDYEEFRKTWHKGDKGILHFRSALRYIKQRQGSEWVDEEYKTGKDFWGEGDNLPWEEEK